MNEGTLNERARHGDLTHAGDAGSDGGANGGRHARRTPPATFRRLLVERDGPVVHARLNCPESGNCLTEEVLDELLAMLALVRDEPEVRVLTLSGAGDDFCLGGDRAEYDALMAQDPTGGAIRALGAKARQLCDGLATSDVVTVARLHGRVIGAGLALSLFCDLRAGADTCRFRMPELAVGLPVAWGGALPRLIQEAGAARARELLLTGNSFDAGTARELGVLHRVVPEAQLPDAVDGWVRPLVRRSATALHVTKAVLNSYAASSRMADASLLEGDLLAAVLTARQQRPGAST